MQAGDLRRRITVQSRSTSQDSAGQQVTTWTDVATVWANIESLTARELLAAQATSSEVTHKITVRYQAEFANPVVVATYRAVYGARIFNIHGAMNVDEGNREIDMLASEGLSNG